MEDQKQPPIITGPNDGQTVSIMGGNYRILAAGKDNGGAFAAIEMLVPPNGGPGPHSHASFIETFYVVEGEVEVTSEAGTYVARKGSYIVIPKGGIVHKFKNISDKLANLLCVVVPSGLEEMFLEIGQPVEHGNFIPPPVMDEAMMKKMKAVSEKYGQQLFPPDYFDKK